MERVNGENKGDICYTLNNEDKFKKQELVRDLFLSQCLFVGKESLGLSISTSY